MDQGPRLLKDLGERRILREIIPKFVIGAGSDCAEFIPQGRTIVVTTDPVPKPAAEVIAGNRDLYWLGWLLVTINASDVAASGARPETFVASLDLPGELPVAEFERLLEGIKDSCNRNGLRYVGGNIRETNSEIKAVGTAIGSTNTKPLNRVGLHLGDRIVLLGNGGRFWEDIKKIRRGDEIEPFSSPVFSPVSQSNVVWKLHEAGLLQCAMDTSDGLAPSLEEIALVNNVSIEIDIGALRPEGTSGNARYWFGWGDWTVLAGVAPNRLDDFNDDLRKIGATGTIIGTALRGPAAVHLRDEGRVCRADRLESERFADDSWFKVGIKAYEEALERFLLP